MTRFVDKRCEAVDTPDPEDENVRLARRRAVREAAARRDMELAPALLAEQDVRDSESRCDQLADDHARLCEPWQTELGELEQRAIERIGRREAPDADEDARRGELSRLIVEATSDLEKAIAVEHELQADRRRKARKIREGNPPGSILLMALSKTPLANPRLLAELHVCRERIRWLKVRESAAERSLKIHRYNLSEIQAKRKTPP